MTSLYSLPILLIILFSTSTTTFTHAQRIPLAWEFQSVNLAPLPRMYHSMASLYDTIKADSSILFGGRCNNSGKGPFFVHNDTWVFNLTTLWTRVETESVPPSRYMHSMASTHFGSAVLFGGENLDQTRFGDTWFFNYQKLNWEELTPTSDTGNPIDNLLPKPRSHHCLETFRPDNYSHPLVLMFGGRLSSTLPVSPPQVVDTDETWVLEILGNTGGLTDTLSSKWYLVPTTTAPSARTGHATSRLGRNSIVLFGGYDSTNKILLGDTWVFIAKNQKTAKWTLLPDKSNDLSEAAQFYTGCEYPPKRRSASFASFDAETAILFGGTMETKLLTNVYSPYSDGSVWHLSRNTDNVSINVTNRYTWRRIVATDPFLSNPAPRFGHSAATVSGNKADLSLNSLASVFMFGGLGQTNTTHQTVVANQEDTWIFHGGCPIGTHREINNKTGCEGCYACDKGYYKNETAFHAGNACHKCPNGTTTPFSGSPQIFMCSECDVDNVPKKHYGTCSVTQNQLTKWMCDSNYYGNRSGKECIRKCDCGWGSLNCDDGFDGSGKCICLFLFIGDPSCKNPLVSVCIAVFLVLCVFVVCKQFKKSKLEIHVQRRVNMELEVHQSLLSEKHTAEIHDFEDGWKIDERDLEWTTALAVGSFGEVWKGKYSAFPGEVVAIKKFFLTPDNMEHILEKGAFGDREVALLAKTPPHKNIVFVIGAGQLRGNNQIFLVSEFMSGGDLRHLLDNHTDMKTIPWSNRLQIASDIAEGMAFLHSRGLIHRDLKSLNILLDHTGKAKIADFGLSKITGSHNAILRKCNVKGMSKIEEAECKKDALAIQHQQQQQNRFNVQKLTNKEMATITETMRADMMASTNSKWYSKTTNASMSSSFRGNEAISWFLENFPERITVTDAMSIGTKLLQNGYIHFVDVLENECSTNEVYTTLLNDKRIVYAFRQDQYGDTTYVPPQPRSETKSTNSNGSSGKSSDRSSDSSGKSSGNRSTSGGSSSPYETFLTGKIGSLLWMAPEIMDQGDCAVYGLESDVFSYGIVLYEIITRRCPWDTIKNGPLWSKVSEKVIAGERPLIEIPMKRDVLRSEYGRVLLELMERCWSQDPSERPTFDLVAREIHNVRERHTPALTTTSNTSFQGRPSPDKLVATDGTLFTYKKH